MNLIVLVDQSESLRRGIDAPFGETAIYVNPCKLTEQQREQLSERMSGSTVQALSSEAGGERCHLRVPEPTLQGLLEALQRDEDLRKLREDTGNQDNKPDQAAQFKRLYPYLTELEVRLYKRGKLDLGRVDAQQHKADGQVIQEAIKEFPGNIEDVQICPYVASVQDSPTWDSETLVCVETIEQLGYTVLGANKTHYSEAEARVALVQVYFDTDPDWAEGKRYYVAEFRRLCASGAVDRESDNDDEGGDSEW